MFASERLAYRVIYHDNSPLHQLNSITSEDYANLRFADFIQWVNVSRRDGLMTFDGDPAMLDALDLKPAGRWDRISLSSTVVPPDVLFYDGERLGVPAMIMIRISAAGLSREEERDLETLFLQSNEPRIAGSPRAESHFKRDLLFAQRTSTATTGLAWRSARPPMPMTPDFAWR